MREIIRIENLSKKYGNFVALKNVSLEVKEGEIYGLLGPNGAGKTTLMKTIYGKSKYSIEYKELSVFGLNPLKDDIKIRCFTGIVPQDDNLDYELSVLQNLYIFSKYFGLAKKESLKRIEELLNFMELNDKRNVKIRELSGGMRRRLTIARALLNKPSLLILDEPTTGLDPQVRHTIWDKIRKLKAEGVTILITTHYMDEAYQLCDRISIMNLGEKIIEGNPKKLISENIENYVLEIPTNLYKHNKEHHFRSENFGEITRFFSNDLMRLKEFSTSFGVDNLILRQSNLEDLFLKFTGRKLDE
ncbi:MAG: ABC transporter ATP-binding protein [Brevinematales bacterium]|nr:ABC transporter ATP-binding protein [Brevinematales bacterium]